MGRKQGFWIPMTRGLVLLAAAILVFLPVSVLSQGHEEKKADLPERAISVYPLYSRVIISQGDSINMDLIVANRGRNDENILIDLMDIPEGWKIFVKTYDYTITGVNVKSDDFRNLTLRLESPEDASEGEYLVKIHSRTADQKLISDSQVAITIEEKKEEKKPEGVRITSSYPVLTGPTDGRFEFSVEVENNLDEDVTYNLTAEGPQNWTFNFKPAYEDKFITSLRLKANQRQSMAVEVKPPIRATPNQYPITVKADSPKAFGETMLTVILTGTYELRAGTASGLLSLNTVRGEPASLSVYVQNTGSAMLNGVRFLSIQPENWKVAFSPEEIDVLTPEELKQVEMTITPAKESLIGDYSVVLRVEAGRPTQSEKTIELRVAVAASAMWGWIGVGIILFVLGGLVFLFIRLGRR